jgi:MFS family permease
MSPPCFESETSTDVPARLERLPWGSFHTLVVIALGVTWIIDGLEVTLAGALSGAFKQSPTLRFTNTDVGFASSAYLAGAVLGALFFGWLTDRWGRKKLFFITLAVYVTATAATALSWDLPSFALLRFLTGAGIGGSTRRSTLASRNSSQPAIAAAQILRSTVAIGWGRRSAPLVRSYCWTPPS